jgi:predicted RNA-binding Zn ribbon-like protein
MAKPEVRWTFDLSGSHTAIDFANTVSSRHGSHPIERLTSHGALVDFGEQTGLLEPEAAARLRAWGEAEPAAAAALVAAAIGLREALYRVFAAAAGQAPPPPAELATVNSWWHRVELGPAFSWRWSAGEEAPDALLGQVLVGAMELLTSESHRRRIRICEAEDCVWLFFDTSKNHSRRWCDMNQCGNRVKARRFYRRRAERGSEG